VGLYLYLSGQNVVDTSDGARRLISVYGSPNGVGLYLGRVLPFALAFVLLTPRGSWRWLLSAGSGAVMLQAVLLSQSRGAIVLGIPAALVVMLLFWRGRRALGTVLVVLIVGALTLGVLSLALPRLGDLFGSTFTFRRHLWYSSVQLLRERPLRGAGVDQFLYFYRSRYLLPEAWEEPNLSIPDNVVLNYWVNLGLLGVLIAGALQVWFWRTLWRVRGQLNGRDPLRLAMVLGRGGGMAHMLGHGLVDVAYFSINLAFVFFLALAWAQWLSVSTARERV
jgi:O-antigen ligase